MKKLKNEWMNPLSKQEAQLLKQSIMEDVEFVSVLPKEEKKNVYRIPTIIGSLAMCLLLFVWFVPKDVAVVSIDVNPAIEFKVNTKDRVTGVILHNEQAKEVVGDMDLYSVDIEVAIHAVIGKMFQQGYLTSTKNSMLLTVQSDDEEYRKYLKDMLVRDIETSYQMYETPIALLSQELSMRSDYQSVAKQYNISEGKASLIMELVDSNENYRVENFVKMSIQDIQMLVNYKDISYQTITAQGVQSHERYITIEELKNIVRNHANAVIIDFEYEMDCDDNRLVYEVSFTDGVAEYEYEVNAISGEIIDFEVDLDD